MLRLKFLISVLFLSGVLHAQNTVHDTAVTVLGYWKIGDSKKYKCTVIEEEKSGEKLVKQTTRFNIDVKIVDSGTDFYIIKALYHHIIPDSSATREMKACAKMMENLSVTYKTNENGSFVDVVNMEEMRKFISEAFDKTCNLYKGDQELYRALIKLKPMMTSDDMIQETISELGFLHFFHGGEYNRKHPSFGETEFGNLTVGDPFPAEAKVEVSNVATDKTHFTITQYTKLNIPKARPLIIDAVKVILQQMGNDNIPPDNELVKKLDIREICSIRIIADSGWPSKIEDTRTTKIDQYEKKKSVFIAFAN